MSDFDFAHCSDDNGLAASAQLADEAATLAMGARLAESLAPGLVIWLEGDLGSGKTTLVRGVLKALGYAGTVKSPTYPLIEPYVTSRIKLYHFDFYRLINPEEFLDAGLDEYFSDGGICFVEWTCRAIPYLPLPDLVITLTPRDGGRQCEIRAKTETGRICAAQLTGKA
jgi:tRNA threonylcarbamoyladenosine biosynthesis protein TsaE